MTEEHKRKISETKLAFFRNGGFPPRKGKGNPSLKEDRDCLFCGKKFLVYKKISKSYCSISCGSKKSGIAKNYKERNCRECFSKFKPTSGMNYSCSEECKVLGVRRNKLSEYYRQREYYLEKSKEWHSKNAERVKILARRWKINNRKVITFHQRRRILQLEQVGGKHTIQEWEALKLKYNSMCLCCKQQEPFIKLTEDHIVPISKGGTDDISNIQPLCNSCNSRKGIKTIQYAYPSDV